MKIIQITVKRHDRDLSTQISDLRQIAEDFKQEEIEVVHHGCWNELQSTLVELKDTIGYGILGVLKLDQVSFLVMNGWEIVILLDHLALDQPVIPIMAT